MTFYANDPKTDRKWPMTSNRDGHAIAWQFRYASPSADDFRQAAAIIDAYVDLTSGRSPQAKLASARRAMRAADRKRNREMRESDNGAGEAP